MTDIRAPTRRTARSLYAEWVVGEEGLLPLIRYELLTGLLRGLPGALGLLLRSKLYPSILGSSDGAFFGTSVTLRGPGRIHLGTRTTIDEQVELSTRDGGTLRIGKRVKIGRGSIVRARGGEIEIGDDVVFGTNCRIGTVDRLTVGKWSLIGANCAIGSPNYRWDRDDRPMALQGVVGKGGVVIGEDVFIGINATVLDGVRIGSGSVIGAGALVRTDVPEHTVLVPHQQQLLLDRGDESAHGEVSGRVEPTPEARTAERSASRGDPSVGFERGEVLAAIYEAIDEINPLLSPELRLAKAPDTALMKPDGVLDSLGVVNLIVALEQRISSRFEVQLSLANGDMGALAASALRSVGALATRVEELLAGRDHE